MSVTPPNSGARASGTFAPARSSSPPSSPISTAPTYPTRLQTRPGVEASPSLPTLSSSGRNTDVRVDAPNDEFESGTTAKPKITSSPKTTSAAESNPPAPPNPPSTAMTTPTSPPVLSAQTLAPTPTLPISANAIPPTLREILHAYALHDNTTKDRGMLLDVLRAKSAEDQRIAALANVQLIHMQASILQLGATLSSASSSTGPSPLEILLRASAGGFGFGALTGGTRPRPLSSSPSSLSGPTPLAPRNLRAPSASDVPTDASTDPRPASSHRYSSISRSLSPHSHHTVKRRRVGSMEVDVDADVDMDSPGPGHHGDLPDPRPHVRGQGQVRHLSPPISHIGAPSRSRGDNSTTAGVEQRSPLSRVQPKHPSYSSHQTHTSTTSSVRATTSGGGSTITTTTAPTLSRKPLAHLLAPLPTHSVLYPSRRNHPGRTQGQSPSGTGSGNDGGSGESAAGARPTGSTSSSSSTPTANAEMKGVLDTQTTPDARVAVESPAGTSFVVIDDSSDHQKLGGQESTSSGQGTP